MSAAARASCFSTLVAGVSPPSRRICSFGNRLPSPVNVLLLKQLHYRCAHTRASPICASQLVFLGPDKAVKDVICCENLIVLGIVLLPCAAFRDPVLTCMIALFLSAIETTSPIKQAIVYPERNYCTEALGGCSDIPNFLSSLSCMHLIAAFTTCCAERDVQTSASQCSSGAVTSCSRPSHDTTM